jgi:hypothetical protein
MNKPTKHPYAGRDDTKRFKLQHSEDRFMPYTQLKNHWVMSLLERDDLNNPTGAFIQC